MVTFRNNNNNNRRSNFRRNNRNFKSNGDSSKFGSNFSNNDNFKRKALEEIIAAPKLIEKYNDLAGKPYQTVTKYYPRIIYNMQIISPEYLMREKIIEERS